MVKKKESTMKHRREKDTFYFYFELDYYILLWLLITLTLSNDSIRLLVNLGRVINNFNIDSASFYTTKDNNHLLLTTFLLFNNNCEDNYYNSYCFSWGVSVINNKSY